MFGFFVLTKKNIVKTFFNTKKAEDKVFLGYCILRKGFEQMAKEDGLDVSAYDHVDIINSILEFKNSGNLL